MRVLLMVSGLLLLVLGVLFMALGAGYLPWPAESLVAGAHTSVYYGGGVVAVGFILIFASQYS